MSLRSLLSQGLGSHQAHVVVGRLEDLADCHTIVSFWLPAGGCQREAALGSSQVSGEAALSLPSITGDTST